MKDVPADKLAGVLLEDASQTASFEIDLLDEAATVKLIAALERRGCLVKRIPFKTRISVTRNPDLREEA